MVMWVDNYTTNSNPTNDQKDRHHTKPGSATWPDTLQSSPKEQGLPRAIETHVLAEVRSTR